MSFIYEPDVTSRHRCSPPPGDYSYREHWSHSPIGTIWQCECKKYWRTIKFGYRSKVWSRVYWYHLNEQIKIKEQKAKEKKNVEAE